MKTVIDNDFAFYFSTFSVYWCRCQSRWENLNRGQYSFQPIKFVNLVVPSPWELININTNGTLLFVLSLWIFAYTSY